MRRLALIALLWMVFIAAGCSQPSASTTPAASATPELPHWKLYERALADILLGPPGRTLPDLSQDHGLCEWVILGQEGHDVYIWTVCQVAYSASGSAASAPMIIRLGEDGSIAEVIGPLDGSGNVATLFPKGLLDGIYDSPSAGLPDAMDHIDLRRHDPSIPPQIVLDGVQLP
jgi:hypothetical protein